MENDALFIENDLQQFIPGTQPGPGDLTELLESVETAGHRRKTGDETL
jgi:hypothetical protein